MGSKKNNWNYPTTVWIGAGRSEEVSFACKNLGITAPLVVTDAVLAATPLVEHIVDYCKFGGLACRVFSMIKPNPTGTNVEDGIRSYHDGQHNGVIAIGGGSALDAGKAIAFMVGQDSTLWDFEDIGDNWMRANNKKIASIVALPTTAGTGSEVGRASVILDEKAEKKKIIFHPNMMPSIVILDPELTIGLPPHLTAATGMDALSHNLEAWCSPMYHPMAEGIAVEGIRLIREYLPAVVADGSDVEARTQMLVASTMGATAFQRGLGGMHALSHPLGALYDAHHGTLNAILMPYVLEANRQVVSPMISRLAQYIDLDVSTFDGFLDWILRLRSDIGIPEDLTQLKIDDSRAEKIGRMAVEDPSAATNPIIFSARDYENIFCNAVNGDIGRGAL
jgi:alcohol dehydrogenase class IV